MEHKLHWQECLMTWFNQVPTPIWLLKNACVFIPIGRSVRISLNISTFLYPFRTFSCAFTTRFILFHRSFRTHSFIAFWFEFWTILEQNPPNRRTNWFTWMLFSGAALYRKNPWMVDNVRIPLMETIIDDIFCWYWIINTIKHD